MSFATYLRSLKLKEIGIKYIPLTDIKCQYNIDKYRYYLEACGSLDIKRSPFYHYLSYRDVTNYVRLFQLYGRNQKWITDNIKKFDAMALDIKNNGFDYLKSIPIVLNKPIIENKYNYGHEIYEGHRRLSIAMYYDIPIKVKLCEVV